MQKKGSGQVVQNRNPTITSAKTVRNSIKKVRASIDKAEVTKQIPGVVSTVDKLAKKKVIHKNKAANLKSKLMRKAASFEKKAE